MPTDEQRALWAAIRAHPADDTPRLVYADWLQENGDDARAEFIRLQCQIVRLPNDRKTARKILPALKHRERVLATANRERWTAALARALARQGPKGSQPWRSGIGFRRGFVYGLRLDLDGAHRLTTAGDDLEPLDTVSVFQLRGGYNPRKLAEVFAWGGVGCVELLTLAGATDDGVGHLTAAASARIYYLELAGGGVTDAGAAALAGWPCGAGVLYLGLSDNRIGDRGADALAASPFLTNARELNLRGNGIGPAARRRLVRRFGGNVLLDPEG
jgi:uncharacterized protein (TIGR02996 family)